MEIISSVLAGSEIREGFGKLAHLLAKKMLKQVWVLSGAELYHHQVIPPVSTVSQGSGVDPEPHKGGAGILRGSSGGTLRQMERLPLQTVHVSRCDILFGKVSFLLGVTGVEELGGRFLVLGLGYEFLPFQLASLGPHCPAHLAELRA